MLREQIRRSTVFLAVAVGLAPHPHAVPNPAATIDQLAAILYFRHGIRVIPEFSRPLGRVDGEPMSGDRAEPFEIVRLLGIVETVLADYPPRFTRRAIFPNLVICRDLICQARPTAAVTDFPSQTWFLSVNGLLDGDRLVRRYVHHEVFHMVDARDDGRLEDEAWSRLNLPSFRYGPTEDRGWSALPGFSTDYSTTDVAEDKAELFALMMTDPGMVAVKSRDDPILQRKVEAMSALLKRFEPRFRFPRHSDPRVRRD